ncbi:AAA family ATPase [Phenylobacterium deserti]|uniref:ATPase n=1 Tax=Phenylobacterium deserti TaxID=1914756 RepID=A0A328ASG2_9CAUL|nr:ATP-binding protein [Phenylobacterium deserti]RAK57255.1 ATPase [Phenylobacterium deserti]
MSIKPEVLIEMTDAALEADYTRVRRAANLIARQLAADGDESSAVQIRGLLRKRGVPLRASGHMESLPVDQKSRLPLVEEQAPPSTPMFLNADAGKLVSDFLWDVAHVDRLEREGISTRLSMLMSGAPGTGKTSLAGHIAQQLNRPLYVVRLDSVVSSLLGDTAKNVRAMFDFFNHREGVLFLDEMDAIAKLRDDRQELGELKRVVNTVIQGLDAVDGRTVVIGATNHPQLLDPAIWRRFPYKLDIGLPDREVRSEMWNYYLSKGSSGELATLLSSISDGLSGADIQTIAYAARRHAALSDNRRIDEAAVVEAILRSSFGAPSLPSREGVSQERRRDIAIKLAALGFNAPKIGSLLGVSRQWALKMTRENDDLRRDLNT